MRSIVVALLLLPVTIQAQEGLPPFPGVDEGAFSVYDQTSFLTMMGVAALSYGVSEFMFDEDNLNFYQAGTTYYLGQDNTSIFMESFSIEKRLSSWYAITLELMAQQWMGNGYSGAGVGFIPRYRWYLLGKKKWSPFLATGAGVFQGFKKFPEEGSNFTFHLTTHLGLEYTLNNTNRLRLSYGHLHQSNNGLFPSNPGMVGNGLNVTYAWYWKTTRW